MSYSVSGLDQSGITLFLKAMPRMVDHFYMRLPRPPPPPPAYPGWTDFYPFFSALGPHGRPVMLVAPSSLPGIIIHNRATQRLVWSSNLATSSPTVSFFYLYLTQFFIPYMWNLARVPRKLLKFALTATTACCMECYFTACAYTGYIDHWTLFSGMGLNNSTFRARMGLFRD